jgi:hypothetical protein
LQSELAYFFVATDVQISQGSLRNEMSDIVEWDGMLEICESLGKAHNMVGQLGVYVARKVRQVEYL